MPLGLKNMIRRGAEQHEGVSAVNVFLLRVLFGLMFLLLGYDAWTRLLTQRAGWSPAEAAAWCIWASFSVLAVIGLFRPLKMLPLVLLDIAYKLLWLSLVAYPLWAAGQLAGSPAEEMTYAFLWVALPIAAMPWKYAFETYLWKSKRASGAQPGRKVAS